jgi:tetraacyldisaccharide 4'-kinase
MMERLLAVGNRAGLGWILSPLIPLAYGYGLAMWVRAAMYARGLLARRSLSCRVISVGNLTVGGTGKTPVVIALANLLKGRGRKVGVISRGYGRQSKGKVFEVSDGIAIQDDWRDTGDEPNLIARRCPGVPVAVGADRLRVGRYLIDRFGVDTVLLDDGFQHLALERDLNILILDATDPFGNGYALPRGRLREPLSALGRATAVLVTRTRQAGSLEELKTRVRAMVPALPILISDFAPSAVVSVRGSALLEPTILKGERVLAVSGIGNPDSFRRLLVGAGATVLDHCVFRDHHAYSAEDIRRIMQAGDRLGADRIVTTEKDAVKLGEFEEDLKYGRSIWAVRIELEWIEGQKEWECLVLQS